MTNEGFVMKLEEQPQVNITLPIYIDGAPYMSKGVRTVWTGGKDGDNFKVLPIRM